MLVAVPPLETLRWLLELTVVLFAIPPLETNMEPLFMSELFAIPPLKM